MNLQEVSLDARVGDGPKQLLVETEAGRTLVTRNGSSKKDRLSLTGHLPDGRQVSLSRVPRDSTLRQAVASLSSARPIRAFALPRGKIEPRYRPVATVASYLPLVVGVLVGGAGLIWSALGAWRFLLLGLGVALLTISADALNKSKRFRRWAINTGDAVHLAAELELPPVPDRIEVDEVKEAYGALLSDIAYRIENPALFDTHEPTSKAFTLALLQWDNNEGVMPDDERRELAGKVRHTFAAAKANAERLGMDHLPADARPRAATALKAARLAADTSATAPEREEALRKAVEILDGLALYYLPTGGDARKAITGRGLLQLPGRRSA